MSSIYNTILSTAVLVTLVGPCTIEPSTELPLPAEPMNPSASPVLIAENRPSVTRDEKLEFVKLLYLEAGVQSRRCKEMVAGVVANRWKSGKWGDSLHDVIFAEGQFSPAYLISRTEPFVCRESQYYEKSPEFIGNWKDCYEVVDEAISGEIDLPPYVLYFSSEAPFDWQGYHVYAEVDGMYFGYLEKDAR